MSKNRWLEVGDLLGRLGIGIYFLSAAYHRVLRISYTLNTWDPDSASMGLLRILANSSVLVFAIVAVGAAVFRLKPIRSADGIEPRLTALIGTFLMLSLIFIASPDDPPPLITVLALMHLASGTFMAAYVLSWLGKSFSFMAQARKLVTGGPYRIVRHPLYVTEEIATIGLILLSWSWLALLIGIVHWCVQLRRMHNEETVLRKVFPEYEIYARRTPGVIPRLSALAPRLRA